MLSLNPHIRVVLGVPEPLNLRASPHDRRGCTVVGEETAVKRVRQRANS